MRTKSYILAASLCCMLPFIAQGADSEEESPPGGGPKAPLRSVRISPILVETDFGMLTLHFRSDLGEIGVSLQQIAGKVSYSEPVDTSVQDHVVLTAPAGSYVLTIIDAVGNIIKQDIVDIP